MGQGFKGYFAYDFISVLAFFSISPDPSNP